MGKAAVNKQSAIDITESSRQLEAAFTNQSPDKFIGPEPVHVGGGESVAVNDIKPATIYRWKAMTQGDQGLKSALYDFVNTTKEGVKVTPDVVHGREKKMIFNFFGSMGKSIMPGEIGEFELIFRYPPSVSTGTGTISIPTTPPVSTNNQGQI